MYVLVNQEQLELKKARAALYNSIPDGRLIVPLGDAKVFGTLKSVDIIGSARELKELIREQEAGMEEDVDPGFSVEPVPGGRVIPARIFPKTPRPKKAARKAGRPEAQDN